MTLYLDCEFSRFHGKLISLALASTTGEHWYRVLLLPDDMHPWVKENVVPVLGAEPDKPVVFRASLWEYLRTHRSETIIADWPEDFGHLMQWLCEPNGMGLALELDMRLIRSGELKPDVPHNALSDAIALMHWHVGQGG